MSRDNIEKTCEQLVEQLGGYNPRTTLIIAVGGLGVGYLLGGLANRAFGPAYLLLPLGVCLVAAIVIVAQKNQLTERLKERFPTNRPAVQAPASAPTQRPVTPSVQQRPAEPAAVELSELEHLIMERVTQGDGNLSVSAIAGESGVSGDDVRKAIENLASQGLIDLG